MVTQRQARLTCAACGPVDCSTGAVVLLVATNGMRVQFDCPVCESRRVLDVDEAGARVLSAYGVGTAVQREVPSSQRTTGA